MTISPAAAIGTASRAPAKPPAAPPIRALRITRNGEIPIVFRMTSGTRTLPSTIWRTVHAGNHEGELRRDGRRDEDRRDRPEQRAHDRDRLGEGREQPEEQAGRHPEDRVGDGGRDADRAHQDQLATDPATKAILAAFQASWAPPRRS